MKQSWKGRSLPHETELIMNTNLPLKLLQTESHRTKLVSSCLCIYVKDFTGIIKYCLYFCFLGTLYDGEKFQLEFKFGSKYPFESPEVKMIFPVSPC